MVGPKADPAPGPGISSPTATPPHVDIKKTESDKGHYVKKSVSDDFMHFPANTCLKITPLRVKNLSQNTPKCVSLITGYYLRFPFYLKLLY
jgi:hypothetical protein